MKLEQLQAACPSAFATKPHRSVSANYTFIPSEPIIKRLYDEGFEAVNVKFRHGDRGDFAYHCIRFQKPNIRPVVSDCFPQLVLSNSHDRSKRFSLLAGLFRLVCSNGLTVSHWSGNFQKAFTKHIGAYDIQTRIATIMEEFPLINTQVNKMMDRSMSKAEVAQLVLDGIVAREGSNIPISSVNQEQWLEARRHEDIGNSLWLTLNRVQENLIKGVSPRSTGLTCPMRIERINTTLWTSAMKLIS